MAAKLKGFWFKKNKTKAVTEHPLWAKTLGDKSLKPQLGSFWFILKRVMDGNRIQNPFLLNLCESCLFALKSGREKCINYIIANINSNWFIGRIKIYDKIRDFFPSTLIVFIVALQSTGMSGLPKLTRGGNLCNFFVLIHKYIFDGTLPLKNPYIYFNNFYL